MPIPKSTSYAQRARYRLQRNPAFYHRFVADFARSGLTLPEYCRTHHVAESTYYRYLKQSRPQPAHGHAQADARLLPLRTPPPPLADPPACTLAFPNGCRLSFSELTAETWQLLRPFLAQGL